MNTTIATGTLLVALAAVALVPAASAGGPLSVEADVYGAHVEYTYNGVYCENTPFSIGPAFHPQVYSDGDCDVNVVYP